MHPALGIAMALLLLLIGPAATSPSPVLTLPNRANFTNESGNVSISTLNALIPNGFTIGPGAPSTASLHVQDTLVLTLLALAQLAIEDFEQPQESKSWESPQQVVIEIRGLAMHGSQLVKRKFAVWGLYKAIQYMVSHDFRAREFKLWNSWRAVGYVKFSDGSEPKDRSLEWNAGNGIEHDTSSLTNNTASKLSATQPTSISRPFTDNKDLEYEIELSDILIDRSNVFMCIYSALVKAASHDQSEPISEFSIDCQSFDTYLYFNERPATGSRGPWFVIGELVELLTYMVTYMISRNNKWVEADAIVLFEDDVLALGKLGSRGGAGQIEAGNVTVA